MVAKMVEHWVAAMVVLTDATWAVRSADQLVASMDERWVVVMVVLKDAMWAVCSVDVTGVPLVAEKVALSVAH